MAPLLPSTSLFYLYVVSAFIISAAVFFFFERKEGERRPDEIEKGLFGYIFDRKVWLHPSSKQDYYFFIVNTFIYSGIIAHFMISGHIVFNAFGNVFESVLGPRQEALFTLSVFTSLAYTLVAVLAIDFAIFLTHYVQHKFAPLWHFHSVHHSAEVLNIVTVYRQHPVDLFITGTFMVVLTEVAFAFYAYLTMSEPAQLTIGGLNVVLFGFYLLGYNLRHSHIWLSYPRWLSYIFISPAQHQTHHSIDEKHFDKNFGFIFAIWDWLFGTLYVPKGYEKLEFGISRAEPNPFGSIVELYLKPFQLAWKEITGSKLFSRFAMGFGVAAVLCVVFSVAF
ncbi:MULTISPECIES: sterol desaturase family protein [unclassified Ruegeria]|uniref:sterol desaturase family protein n=1 Tax=unclassified Ruegeria TaxID=2625375 RepID=UPI001489977A|nr:MULTISPECIES: sterol desaturase family protein [unclassified Ruegeria]